MSESVYPHMSLTYTDSRSMREPLPELPAVGGPTVECHVWHDEQYPTYGVTRLIRPTSKRTISIPRSTLANWERILREYDKMQQEMELYEAHQERG